MVGAVAAVALGAALILVAVVPSMLEHTVQTMSKNADVSQGVRTLRTGIDMYAAEHDGRFPDPGEVNPPRPEPVRHLLAAEPVLAAAHGRRRRRGQLPL